MEEEDGTSRENWILQIPSQQYVQGEIPKTLLKLKDDLILFQKKRQFWIAHKKGVKPESRAVAIRDLNQKIEAIEQNIKEKGRKPLSDC